MRLKNKLAIVVGGGQTPGETIGNGRAIAVLFAREGAEVVVADRDLAAAEATCTPIEEEGGRATPLQADVTSAADCARIADRARIDVLVNNVGIMAGDSALAGHDEAAWDRILDTNLKGMYLTCRAVLPVMRAQGSGAIVNISSTAALWSGDPYIAYNTSKAGVNGLTTAMTLDCARCGIRVNAVMPGSMHTPMAIDAVIAEKGQDLAARIAERDTAIPLGGKMGTAWDVAQAALFLASDEARFITGALLPVDGGQLLKR